MSARESCPGGPFQGGSDQYTTKRRGAVEHRHGLSARSVAWTVTACVLAPGVSHTATAQPGPPSVSLPSSDGGDGQGYLVSGFQLTYHETIPGLPRIEIVRDAFQDMEISLIQVTDGYVALRPRLAPKPFTVNELTIDGPTTIYSTALYTIERSLRQWFLGRGFDVFVTRDPGDIDPAGQDLRSPDRENRLLLTIVYDGPFFPVSGFELLYTPPDDPGRPQLPPPAMVLDHVEVMLVPTDRGFAAWRPGVAPVAVRLGDLARVEQFSAGALQAVLTAVFEYYRGEDFLGVRVNLPDDELNVTEGVDSRNGRTTLRIQAIIGRVTELRTLARGDRIDPQDRINNTKHQRIRDKSPFQPAGDGNDEAGQILKQKELDDYLFRMSRHPGRRLDASLAPSEDPYGIALDFHVTENRPWIVYGSASNTGTAQTNRMRYRLGAFVNQLANVDDLLSVEWVTAGPGNNSLVASYGARLGDSEVLRWRVFGNWAEFSASEVGRASEAFIGKAASIGAQLDWNIYQDRELFVDVFGGVRWSDNEVTNRIIKTTGREDYVLPFVGISMQRYTEEMSTNALLQLEWNMGPVDSRELNQLGRIDPAEHFAILRWDASLSFFLEPVFNRQAWLDLDTPKSSTLAHEILLRVRGQYSFDDRLIPQYEQTLGGLYTVRGYPESVVVGDSAILGNIEYRYHIPRGLPWDSQPGTLFNEPFRWAPQYPYGRADWDLMLRAFVDAGATFISDPRSFESEQTLIGTGVGLEFQYKTNVVIRVDWGFALKSVPGFDSGGDRVHFAASILY